MSEITIDSNLITMTQAKLMHLNSFTRTTEYGLKQQSGNVTLCIQADSNVKLPAYNKPIKFHYMEETDDATGDKYWCCCISTLLNMFTNKRKVLVLKVAKSDSKGNDIVLENKDSPFPAVGETFLH